VISITINGNKVEVEAGTTVLEAARSLGIKIPTLCYEPRLSKPGACRICIVEIKGMRNLPASCVTEVAQGMEIETHSPAVIEARKTILELLLANHPLDCLSCDKAGECQLQEYCYEYGVKQSGFEGEKHDYDLDDSNPYILRDNNKCILCGRCVRACDELSGRNVVDFAYRGFNTKVTPALDATLVDSDCAFCNNCVSVCPVGALLDKQLAGKGRFWEIDREEVTCAICENGCRFEVKSKKGKVIGVSAKEAGLGRPLCLKGRLGTELLHNPNRTAPPVIRKDGQLAEVGWEEALGFDQMFKNARRQ
jgi:NADP-reducing hydrogenase subunit HndD